MNLILNEVKELVLLAGEEAGETTAAAGGESNVFTFL